MQNKYTLVNPRILGDYNSVFSASAPEKAAEDAWLSISKHITNNLPQFALSIEDQSTKKLHHYVIKESTGGGKIADYTIEKLDINVTPKQLSDFKSAHKKVGSSNKHVGGHRRTSRKRYDESSSSSSSSDDEDDIYKKVKLFNKKNMAQPIAYWWYYPSLYNMNSLYIPTFNVPLTPYVEINFSSAFMG